MLRFGNSRRERALRAAERDIKRYDREFENRPRDFSAEQQRRSLYNFGTNGPQNPKEARKAIRDTHEVGREISEYLPEAKDRSKLLPYLTHSTLEPPPAQDMRHTICLPKNNTVFRTQKDASGCGPFVSQEDGNELCCTQLSDSALCASVFAILNGTSREMLQDPQRVGRIEREMYAWMKELNPGMLPAFPVVNINTGGGAGDEALIRLAVKTETSARIEIGLHLQNQDLPRYPYVPELFPFLHFHDTINKLSGDVRIYAHELGASLSFDAFSESVDVTSCREVCIDCPIDCNNRDEFDVAETIRLATRFYMNSRHDTFLLRFGLPNAISVFSVGAELLGNTPPTQTQWQQRTGIMNGPTSTFQHVRDGVTRRYVVTVDYIEGNRICVRCARV